MLGWQTVSGIVNDVDMETALMVLRKERFIVKEHGEHHALLHRKGTEFTSQGKKVSMEAALIVDKDSLRLELRYNTFVLFDTGDLEKELAAIIALMEDFNGLSNAPVALLKVLADEKRYQALVLLSKGDMHNGDLAKALSVKPTTMSHHMAKLMAVGLVKVYQGQQNKSIYVLNKERVTYELSAIIQHICDENQE